MARTVKQAVVESGSRASPSFMGLPAELRLRIYDFALRGVVVGASPGRRKDGKEFKVPRRYLRDLTQPTYERGMATIPASAFPGVLVVSRLVHDESRPVFHRHVSFAFPSPRALVDVVNCAPPHRLASLTRVRLYDFPFLYYKTTEKLPRHEFDAEYASISLALKLCHGLRLQHLFIETTYNLEQPRYEHWGEQFLVNPVADLFNMVEELVVVSRTRLRLRYFEPNARRFAREREELPQAKDRAVTFMIRDKELRAETCFSIRADCHISPLQMKAELQAMDIDPDWLQELTAATATRFQERYQLSYLPKAVITMRNSPESVQPIDTASFDDNGARWIKAKLGEHVWRDFRQSSQVLIHDCMDFRHYYRNKLYMDPSESGEESDASFCSEAEPDGGEGARHR